MLALPDLLSAIKMARTGRPPYEPTERDRQTVEIMVAAGIERPNIALCVGISEPTLRKHFRRELDTASVRANTRVAAALFKKATSDDHPGAVTAAIWWTKCRNRWAEVVKNEHTGANGEEIVVRIAGTDADL